MSGKEAPAPEEKKSGKGKLIIIIVAVLIAVGVAVFFLLPGDEETEDELAGEQTEEVAEPTPPPEPIFIKIGPLTVNLMDDAYGTNLLYTTITLKVDNEQTEELINKYMPDVHSRLLMLLSSKKTSDLTNPEGKKQLSEEILALFDEPLADPQPELAISHVLFTEFIVQ